MRADLVGFSLAIEPGKACYVPLGHRSSGAELDFGGGEEIAQLSVSEALALLKPLLEDSSILKIGQNLKFDFNVLARHGVRIASLDDTMLMSYALDAGKGSHGMDELAMRHLGHACISFETRHGARARQEEVGAHASRRCRSTRRPSTRPRTPTSPCVCGWCSRPGSWPSAWRPSTKRWSVRCCPSLPTWSAPASRSMPASCRACPARSRKAWRGWRSEVERPRRPQVQPGLAAPARRAAVRSPAAAGRQAHQVGAVGDARGLLDDLAANEELPEDARKLINTMLEWRQLTKLRSTYTDALPGYVNAETGRIHTCYALGATTTGRLASSEPNLQNIPIRTKEGREIRTAFIAEKGMKLVSADYSQIELRVLAHIADIPQLKKAFDEGLDIHAMTASEMFDVPVKDMPPDVRRRAKAINFGIIYGISAFGLANQLGIAREEAGAYIKTYFERFPGIRDYMEATKKRAHEQGFVETVFGRRIHYPEINTRNPSMRGFLERAAINAPIQGSAADIIRRAMVRMPGALDEAGLKSARMLLQVHDELVFEVKEAEVAKTLKTVRQGDGGCGAAGRGAERADQRRCQGRRQLGGRALARIQPGCPERRPGRPYAKHGSAMTPG